MQRDGRNVEELGAYKQLLPTDGEERLQKSMERIEYWLGKGAQPTDRVSSMLEAAGAAPAKERSNPKKGTPGKKAQERAEEKAAKAAEATAAAEAPAEAVTEDAAAEE